MVSFGQVSKNIMNMIIINFSLMMVTHLGWCKIIWTWFKCFHFWH